MSCTVAVTWSGSVDSGTQVVWWACPWWSQLQVENLRRCLGARHAHTQTTAAQFRSGSPDPACGDWTLSNLWQLAPTKLVQGCCLLFRDVTEQTTSQNSCRPYAMGHCVPLRVHHTTCEAWWESELPQKTRDTHR
jgi:hypothetical protein